MYNNEIMKKLFLSTLFVVACLTTFAQSVTLTFTGKDTKNQYVQLNRVEIINVTQGWSEMIYYPDTILIMGSTGIDDMEGANISSMQLSQNVPNPFDGTTDFALQLPEAGKVSLTVCDLNGKRITAYQGRLAAGIHTFRVLLNTTQSYLLTARCGGEVASIKMVNNGQSGENAIRYVGDGSIRPLTMPLKVGTKGAIDKPFTPGDEMKYTGCTLIDGSEDYPQWSQTIEKSQSQSENIELIFAALPVVTTADVSEITANSAVCGGEVVDDGGSEIVFKGVCWSTEHNPTIGDSKTNEGSSTGQFTSNLTSLTPQTTYYVRAYATNKIGTAYGEEKNFTTESCPFPKVIMNSLVWSDGVLSGQATSSLSATVYECYISDKGICWSTSPVPTIEDAHISCGGGSGDYTFTIDSLKPDTIYYLRAYATNGGGTVYSNQYRKFYVLSEDGVPCKNAATVTDRDGNTYNTVQIGSQCWMKENLKTTKYADGTDIKQGSSTSTTEALWYFPNENADNKATYGLLYNRMAVMNGANASNANPSGVQGICPNGWHVPSNAEWTDLFDYVGGQNKYVCAPQQNYQYPFIASALASTEGWEKETGTSMMCTVGYAQDIKNNATGFSAFPAGEYRDDAVTTFGKYAWFWCASAESHLTNDSDCMQLAAHRSDVEISGQHRNEWAISVRCVKN